MKIFRLSACCGTLVLLIASNVQAAAIPSATAQAANPRLPNPPSPRTNEVTPSDILGMTRLVLETSQQHAAQQHTNLTYLGYLIGGIFALLSFMGFREFKSIIKPYKDKLDALKDDHETRMGEQLREFRERSHNNAKALVAAQVIWGLVSQVEKMSDDAVEARTELFNAVVRHVERALPVEYETKLDPYLSGLLLIRKAYALRRLNDIAGAFAAAKAAVAVDGDASKGVWVYNAACYAALLHKSDDCFALLAEAIKIDPVNRADAVAETDFDSVRNLPAFIALISAG